MISRRSGTQFAAGAAIVIASTASLVPEMPLSTQEPALAVEVYPIGQAALEVVEPTVEQTVFTPDVLPSLVAWYDADAAYITKDGSSRVSAWTPRYTNDSDANKALAAIGGQEPLWAASDANLNGKPSLTFSEARPDRMSSGTWATANPTGSTYLIVGCHSTTRDSTAWPYMDSADGTATNRQATYALTSNQLLTFGSGTDVVSTTAVPAGVVPFVIAVTYGASGKLWWKAKTAIKTGNSGTQTLPSLRLGGNAVLTANVYFDGAIAEVIAYNTALSQAEVEALLTWAGAKYGITIGA